MWGVVMMLRQNPADAELGLLKVLWEDGPCTVGQAQARVKENPLRPVWPEELAGIRLMPDEMEAGSK
jgi:hypothetical protein